MKLFLIVYDDIRDSFLFSYFSIKFKITIMLIHHSLTNIHQNIISFSFPTHSNVMLF